MTTLFIAAGILLLLCLIVGVTIGVLQTRDEEPGLSPKEVVHIVLQQKHGLQMLKQGRI